MINLLEKLIEKLSADIKFDIIRGDKDTIAMMLDAYNDYQESERDGVDYIFDLENKDEIISLLKQGMTLDELSELMCGFREKKHAKYFFFGCNHIKPEPIKDEKQLTSILSDTEYVVADIIKYPYAYKSYENVYKEYVTNSLID